MFGFENHKLQGSFAKQSRSFPQFFIAIMKPTKKSAENPTNDLESGKLQKSVFARPAKCTGVCFLKNNLTISCAHNWRKNDF
jgi:hypothetical protein